MNDKLPKMVNPGVDIHEQDNRIPWGKQVATQWRTPDMTYIMGNNQDISKYDQNRMKYLKQHTGIVY